MKIQKLVPMITTDRLAECRAFYATHFDGQVTYESPMYVGLKLPGGAEIGFMKPNGDPNEPVYRGGATLGVEVADVDGEHARLSKAGLTIVRALQDNPWGDRSFAVVDPAGVAVYVHKPIALAAEYAKYLKS